MNRSEQLETEANRFAACYLMPRRLLTRHFEATFQTKVPFAFTEGPAFQLCRDDPDSLLRPEGPLDRALALASAEFFNGRRIYSLAQQFKVSRLTMAIRLKELGLVED